MWTQTRPSVLPLPPEHPAESSLQGSLGGGQAASARERAAPSEGFTSAPGGATPSRRTRKRVSRAGRRVACRGAADCFYASSQEPQPQQPQIPCVGTEGPPGLAPPALPPMPAQQSSSSRPSVLGLQLPRTLPESRRERALQGGLVQRLILCIGFLAVAFPTFFCK